MYLRTKSWSSDMLTGLRTNSAARESKPLNLLMNVNRASNSGSSLQMESVNC